jgi:diaminopimelate epimerase
MHGAGNDYIYVDARRIDRDWPALAIAMSDRHTGVGSDGLILIKPSKNAHLRMTMYNADGSEGEMCGNGIRCLVRFALDRGIVGPETIPVQVETPAGVLAVTPLWDGDTMVRASVGMGEPRLRPADIPARDTGGESIVDYPLKIDGQSYSISCVSMGNPHAVAFVDGSVEEVPLHDIGPLVEHHAMFPNRVNFEIVNVIDRATLNIRVWERGSGLTMACGTGACAAVVAARLHGFVDDETTVVLPGGELIVRWPGQGEVVLEGPVAEFFEGEWPDTSPSSRS